MPNFLDPVWGQCARRKRQLDPANEPCIRVPLIRRFNDSEAMCSVHGRGSARAQSSRAEIEREEIVIPDFAASGYILDLGVGCRGTIGRLKGVQVVAIDISMKELDEAPSGFLKILMDASDLKFPKNSFRIEQ